MLISAKVNIQPKPEVYEKNVECPLPKDFIRGVYCPHASFAAEICGV